MALTWTEAKTLLSKANYIEAKIITVKLLFRACIINTHLVNMPVFTNNLRGEQNGGVRKAVEWDYGI